MKNNRTTAQLLIIASAVIEMSSNPDFERIKTLMPISNGISYDELVSALAVIGIDLESLYA